MPTRFGTNDPLEPTDALDVPLRSLPRPSRLDEPLEVPKRAQEAVEALGLHTAGDLLEHFPHTHRDRRDLRSIASLGIGEKATVAAVVRSIKVRPMRNRRMKMVEARVADESGPMVAVWFNQPWLAQQLTPGTAVLLHGEYHRRNQFRVAEHEVHPDVPAQPRHAADRPRPEPDRPVGEVRRDGQLAAVVVEPAVVGEELFTGDEGDKLRRAYQEGHAGRQARDVLLGDERAAPVHFGNDGVCPRSAESQSREFLRAVRDSRIG